MKDYQNRPQQKAYLAVPTERVSEAELIWKAHDKWLRDKGYSEPCGFCMGDAHSLEHSVFEAQLEDLSAPKPPEGRTEDKCLYCDGQKDHYHTKSGETFVDSKPPEGRTE